MLVATGVVLALPLLGLACCCGDPSSTCTGSTTPRTSGWCWPPAALSAVLAYATGVAAERRGDARVLLVSLAFLAAAGFLGLHALATPGVLLDEPNAGFVVATPVGIAIGSVLAARLARSTCPAARCGRCGSAAGSASACSP